MEFLLNKEALKGLSEADQAAVKDQALGQFLLGSIFGGQGIASGYQAVQNIIPSIQQQRQQQGLLKEVANIQEKYFPNEQQETRQALNTNLGRDRLASNPYSLTTSLGLPQENIQAQGRNQPIDFNAALKDVARLSTNPNATKMLPGITEAFKNLQPTVQAGGLITDPNRNVTGGLPQYDAQRGLVSSPTVRGGSVQFNVSSAPGYAKAIESNITYQPQPGEVPLYDRAGNLVSVTTMGGSTENLLARKKAEAQGGAFGLVDTVINPITQQKEYKSRADILGLNNVINGPSLTSGKGTPGITTRSGGGTIAALSPAQEAINATAAKRYDEFTKTSLDAAMTSGDRRTSAEYLYNASEQLDPNKLTEFFATGASYMRAIPGVGDKFDSYVGNVNMFNKTRSEGVLKGLQSIKGNANAFEGGVVDKATTGVTDPKFVTKYLSALEIASADKDDARQKFVDAYTGNPKNVYTAWASSPDNPRIYNHPKVNQFLNEQVRANPSAPVLPAGFGLVQDGKTKQYGIKKPDGSVMLLGQ